MQVVPKEIGDHNTQYMALHATCMTRSTDGGVLFPKILDLISLNFLSALVS